MNPPDDPGRPARGSARIPGSGGYGDSSAGARGSARVPSGSPRQQPRRPDRAQEDQARDDRTAGSRARATSRQEFDRDPRRSSSTPTRRADAAGTGPKGRRKGEVPLGKDGLPLTAEQQKKLRRKKKRRKIYLISFLLILVMMFAGMGAAYAALQVPLPSPSATNQVSIIYYSDGKTELGRLGVDNRESVKIKDVPKPVQEAVVSAEDRTFWSNDGVSIKGTLRALWADASGGDVQGGSTITQQYVKNAFLTQQQTMTRKAKEMILAIKLSREYSKSQILEFYLNTIFWGRGSYGIQAASKAYFGVSVDQLNVSQAALLAGIIKNPTGFDPEVSPKDAKERWKYVLSGMVHAGWLKKSKMESLQFPQTIPRSAAQKDNGLGGATGVIVSRVQQELVDHGISEQQLRTNGLHVVTTIDPSMQKSMQNAVDINMQGQPTNLATAVAAVEPGTGKVVAYYGGGNGYGSYDLAGPKAPHPPGSSMKAYVLGEALKQDIGVDSLWNGSSPRDFSDRPGRPLHNDSDDNSCKVCTLDKATVKSLNTVYWAVSRTVGPQKVVDFAKNAGITRLDSTPITEIRDKVNNGISIGQYSISVLEQADGFATFAAQGRYAKPYFVQSVTQRGDEIYQNSPSTRAAFSSDIAANATTVMQHVVEASRNKLAGGRTSAGKTGTGQFADTAQNAHAWMVGYTPQLATAVWVGNKGQDAPITDKTGSEIYGSGVPGRIWKSFMDQALAGKKNVKFPKAKPIGKEDAGDAPKPTPPPSPTEAAHPSQPAPIPTPTPSPPSEPTGPPSESTGPTFGPNPPTRSARPPLG